MPWGVNVMLYADFGVVYSVDSDGCVALHEHALGIVATDNDWDEGTKCFQQQPGGGAFTFVTSDLFTKSPQGVTSAGLQATLANIFKPDAAAGAAAKKAVANEAAAAPDPPRDDVVLTTKAVNYWEKMKVRADVDRCTAPTASSLCSGLPHPKRQSSVEEWLPFGGQSTVGHGRVDAHRA